MEWYWVIPTAIGTGFIGYLIAKVIESNINNKYFDIKIVENKRIEKTSVEFKEKKFAFPDGLGADLSDLFINFVGDIGYNIYYKPPNTSDSLMKTHILRIERQD